MVRGELSGNPDQVVTGLAGLREATPNDVSFLASPKYQAAAKTTRARVLIVAKDLPVDFDGAVVRVDNPSEAFAELVRQVAPRRSHSRRAFIQRRSWRRPPGWARTYPSSRTP